MENLIDEAIIFAVKAHSGNTRKSEKTPYVFHPLETAHIVTSMTDDTEVIAAAVLHDVVEDTKYTYDDIKTKFGKIVADMVADETEDKMCNMPADASWKVRKEQFLENLKRASVKAKMITLADKLSNMRVTKRAFDEKGTNLWQGFHQKDHNIQGWYYKSILDCISELEHTAAYKEYAELCEYVFGKNG